MVSAGVFCAMPTASAGTPSKTVRVIPLGGAAVAASVRPARAQQAATAAAGASAAVGHVSREGPIALVPRHFSFDNAVVCSIADPTW